MADYTLSALSFAKVFEKEVVEIGNSSAGFLRFIDVMYKPGISCDWVTHDTDGYDISNSAANFAEIGSLAVYTTSGQFTPSLPWGRVLSASQISGTSLRASPAGNPDGLMDLMSFIVREKVANVANFMGTQAFTGTGSNQIVGLNDICSVSNTYAGINRATGSNAAMRGLFLDLQSATLTLRNVQDWINTVAKRNSNMLPDMIVTTYEIQSKIASLLNVNGNYDVNGPPGTMLVQGGYNMLRIGGVPVIADKNCASGEVYLITKSALKLRVNPFNGADGWSRTLDASDPLGPLPFQMGVRQIPTSVDSQALVLGIECQLVASAPSKLMRVTNVGF